MQVFDATQFKPQQGFDQVPPGMYDAQITNTFGQATKDQSGGMFVVEFNTPGGTIKNHYNLWNSNAKAVEIAQKELSALCHATGVFKLTMDQNNLQMAGAELRGARCRIEVAPQKTNPDYMEVKKVFDVNGNEPGKAPSAAPQPQGAGGWGAGAPQPQQQQPQAQPPMQQQPGGGWNAAPQGQPQQQTQAQGQPQGGWQQQPQQQGGPAPNAPPWANRQ